jgi:hypothetical protein
VELAPQGQPYNPLMCDKASLECGDPPWTQRLQDRLVMPAIPWSRAVAAIQHVRAHESMGELRGFRAEDFLEIPLLSVRMITQGPPPGRRHHD